MRYVWLQPAHPGSPGTLAQDQPANAVTFVDNHDTIRDPGSAINNDKLMAYSFILTHEGYPSVFWMDWYNYGLAKSGTPNGIEALVRAHEQAAGGGTDVLYADDDVYIMQRSGFGSAARPGLCAEQSRRRLEWGHRPDAMAQLRSSSPIAYGGSDNSRPDEKTTSSDGHADFWAAPRGWAVFAPQA